MEKIINYAIKKESVFITKPDLYKLTKKSKINAWLIKLLIKLKIIENHIEQTIAYTRVRIDHKKVSELIMHLYNEIYFSTSEEPRKVIIGYDKMRKLDIEIYEEMRFQMPPLKLNGPQGQKIFGLDIVLNPRIDGVVLI